MSGDNKPFCLAIETSGERGGVAVGVNGRILGVRLLNSHRRHAADLLPAIDELCSAHRIKPVDLGAVFVSSGPGSFTGLRIGVTVARMMALAGGAQIVSVPTLDAIAQNAIEMQAKPSHVVVLLDARRNNVYASTLALRGDAYQPTDSPAEVGPAAYLASRPPDCAVLGEGIRCHRDAVLASGLRVLPNEYHAARPENVFHLGGQLLARGESVQPRNLLPTYVRAPEPEEKLNRTIMPRH